MTIEIPADLQAFVRKQLQLGCFHTDEQLVTEALQLLRAEREETLDGVREGFGRRRGWPSPAFGRGVR